MNQLSKLILCNNLVLYFMLNLDSMITLVLGPPIIVAEPEKRIAYREGESIELPCIASGQPEPSLVTLQTFQVKINY